MSLVQRMSVPRGAGQPTAAPRYRSRPPARRPRVLLVAGAVVLAAGVAGCSTPAPEPKPAGDPGAVPVVTDGQLDRVVEDVAAALAAGDQSNDVAAIEPRVAGAALQLRQAQYAIRAAAPAHPAPTPLGTERLVDLVPVDGGWPRYVLTVTEPAEGAVPVLSVLTQPGVRDPYELTASATLLPGTTLPRTPTASTGVEPLPADQQSGLVVSPAQAVAQYASVLTNGASSEHAGAFADDAFRAAVIGEQDAERTAATVTCAGCFSYTVTHTPRADAIWSVRTNDGGALVMAVLDSTRTFTVAAPGAKLPIPADLGVLAGRSEATQSAVVTVVEVVALHVPSEGSDEQIRVLAADRGPVSVTAS